MSDVRAGAGRPSWTSEVRISVASSAELGVEILGEPDLDDFSAVDGIGRVGDRRRLVSGRRGGREEDMKRT
jgi:hypothetical protein